MANGNASDQPWEGGVAVPALPPHVPLFDSAAIVVAQQSDAQAGVAVSYSRGIFTRQFWSTGHPVPGLIEVLKPQEVRQVRDQVREQLAAPGDGLDHLPLRAFVTAADVYLSPEPSTRFDRAVFGTIAEQAPGQLLGAVVLSRRRRRHHSGQRRRGFPQSHISGRFPRASRRRCGSATCDR